MAQCCRWLVLQITVDDAAAWVRDLTSEEFRCRSGQAGGEKAKEE
jgi:hypothetical protein